jgi:hypothetical protein
MPRQRANGAARAAGERSEAAAVRALVQAGCEPAAQGLYGPNRKTVLDDVILVESKKPPSSADLLAVDERVRRNTSKTPVLYRAERRIEIRAPSNSDVRLAATRAGS